VQPLNRRAFLGAATAAGFSPLLAGTRSNDSISSDSRTARSRLNSKTVIIEPTWVVVPDGNRLALLRDHDVVVNDDWIVEVRPHRGGKDVRVTAQGQILLAGFISGHTHSAAGTMTRGFIEENSFESVRSDSPSLPSRSLLRPMVLMEDLTDSQLDDLTALNLAEMLRSGCTSQVEMSLSLKQMKSYVRVAGRFGIRGFPGGMVPGMKRLLPIWGRTDDRVLTDSVADTLAEIRANLAYALQINGSQNGRIRPMMAPSVTSVHTRETFAAIRAAAMQLGNGIHIHIQNDWEDKDRKALQRLWGKLEIPVLEEVGCLSAPTFGAHLLGVDLARDLPVLARNKFTFAHCPSAAGASVLPSSQPYPEALAAGVNTCIGLDTHSNDYLENIKLAVMQGRGRAQLLGSSSPVPMREPTIWNALESATLGGARGLGRSDLGRIEAGAKADFCTVDVSGLLVGNGALPREPYNNLLYANGLSVRNVMTDGNWQWRDGKFVVEDESQIVARAAVVMEDVWRKLEKEGFFVPMPR
jgi:5-methylthioadenosine/S-adenosylhomocysteine deaminase